MQISLFSDLSLRTLLTLAVQANKQKDDVPMTVPRLAEKLNCSKNHLMKVVQRLSAEGWINAIRGRNGGLSLAMDPSEYNMEELLRSLEGRSPCIDCGAHNCPMTGACLLKGELEKAKDQFFRHFKDKTLEDLL